MPGPTAPPAGEDAPGARQGCAALFDGCGGCLDLVWTLLAIAFGVAKCAR